MEDSHISRISIGQHNLTHIFGVFDGHGGKEVSNFVKKNFTKEFLNNKSYLTGDIKNGLIETFLRMDQLMLEPDGKMELKILLKISKEEDEIELDKNYDKSEEEMNTYRRLFNYKYNDDVEVGMMTGCTANVCVIDLISKKIYCANTGDSRAVLCKNGIAYQMSNDHKPSVESEKERIYNAESWVIDGRVNGKIKNSKN